MSWLKIDDGFAENKRVQRLSANAFRLHVIALCYCARNLTDGRMDERDTKIVCAVLSAPRPGRYIDELLREGLWVEFGDAGYEIDGYLEYNPNAETVKEERRKARIRMQELRRKRAGLGEPSDEHSGERTGERSPSPSRPVPVLKSKPLAPPAAPQKKERPKDPAWEALLDVCGIDGATITRGGRGAANAALRDIREAGGADPVEIRSRAAEFRRKWPQITVTPSALAKHWGSLRNVEQQTKADKYAHLMEVDAA